MRRACVLAQEVPKSGCCATTAKELALPTAGCARAGRRSPVPRRRAPQLSSGELPQDLRLPFVVSAWLDNLRRHEYRI